MNGRWLRPNSPSSSAGASAGQWLHKCQPARPDTKSLIVPTESDRLKNRSVALDRDRCAPTQIIVYTGQDRRADLPAHDRNRFKLKPANKM